MFKHFKQFRLPDFCTISRVVAPPEVLAPPPTAAAFVQVQDITNGWSLYEKAPDTQVAPASLVKMATALVVMDYKSANLSETATVIAGDIPAGQTLMNLQTGDVVSYEDLLYGMILPSGGDAALCVARVIGTEVFNAAGSGTTGVTRFVELMNAKATALGLTDTTFASPHGVNAGDVITARSASKLAAAAFSNMTLRTIAGSASRLVTITGANARTYTVDHTSIMATDTNVLSGKTGTISAANAFGGAGGANLSILIETPSGNLVAASVLRVPAQFSGDGSNTLSGDRYLDMRGILYEILQDFPYLDVESTATDAQFSNVVLLTGGDSDFTDESTVARTLTNVGSTRTTTDALFGTHSYSFDGTDDRIEMADANDLSFGSGDFAVEFWFRGKGTEPATSSFVSKYATSNNQREWSIQWDAANDQFVGFASTNGTSFLSAVLNLNANNISVAALFNGAKRHVMFRRSGGMLSVYLNGVKGGTDASVSTSALHNGTAKAMIGARATGAGGAEFFTLAVIDEVRITKGNARQTAAKFTPDPRKFSRA